MKIDNLTKTFLSLNVQFAICVMNVHFPSDDNIWSKVELRYSSIVDLYCVSTYQRVVALKRHCPITTIS